MTARVSLDPVSGSSLSPVVEPAWAAVRRLLVVRLDFLGDVLLATPAIHVLRQHLPDAHIALLTSPSGAQPGRPNPDLDEVIVHGAAWIDPNSQLPFDRQREMRALRRIQAGHFDAAVIFTSYRQSSLPAAYLCYLAGIPLRLATSFDGPGSLLTTRHYRADVRMHEALRSLDLIRAVGFHSEWQDLVLAVPEADREAAELVLSAVRDKLNRWGPTILMHTGSSAPARTYPGELYAAVADSLIDTCDGLIVFTGLADEHDPVERIRGAMTHTSLNVCGRLSFGVLCGLIAASRVVVTNHTGPMHIAAALKATVVALFAHTHDDAEWGPWRTQSVVLNADVPCKLCLNRVCPYTMDCLRRLVAAVSLGKVGLVLMLEASRLARNNSDRHQLIEICGLRGTLIADEQAVYDPRNPNDRLLLGVKGTLSEAELFTLRTRLYEGRWNKARKGELVFPLPVGYIRGADAHWELDPDTQVRERLAYLFAAFRRHGVARAVLRDVVEHHLDLPVRLTSTDGDGALVWKAATLSAVIRTLQNPAYAGAYVFGRWSYTGERRSATNGQILPHLLPEDEWPVCLRDHHPAYLSWDEFIQNRAQLRANANQEWRAGVAREGRALLQGIVSCGVCGRRMSVQHRAAGEHRSSSYLCDRAYAEGALHLCQSMTARPVDAAVVEAFLDAVSPLQLEVALRVLEQIEQDRQALRRQQELQLEQARYETRLAQRQYDAIDPDNRLVAAELERRWNAKLERVAHLEQVAAQAEQEGQWTISTEERSTIRILAQDLPALWQAPTTTNRERKQLLRFAIDAVFLDGTSAPGEIEIQIRWHTGTITVVQVNRPAPGEGSLKTPEEAVARIGELGPPQGYAAIADQLNAAGCQTAFGRAFTSQHVGYLCRRYGWARGKERSGPRTQESDPDTAQGTARRTS